ncbi:hypothetical protein BOX15_Mlig014484g1 [Macrostomum lignano]|uniref:UDENN domain-containing protein n=2 Tax=Macrostomum lignano TaxID=282301 RepID=A0A267E8E1_9PLAT|nr:hypothetical protein BOX15_Mlig014484g1 [Macrostomum lignano]
MAEASSDISADGDSLPAIAGAFVAAFDTHVGNLIEWCRPAELNRPGLEFKAIPSGAHDLDEDFVYLRCGRLFGLAVCVKRDLSLLASPAAAAAERGARVRSVGVLGRRPGPLGRHAAFLRRQADRLLDGGSDYSELAAFVDERRADEPDGDDAIDANALLGLGLTFFSDQRHALAFDAFFEGFGEQLMILWKFMLLRKRVLFCSLPPIGDSCLFVLFACALAAQTGAPAPAPELFVSVADIDRLRGLPHYAACSTESILLHKPDLWHLAITDGWRMRASGPASQRLCSAVTAGDRRRFASASAEYRRRRSPADALRWFADLNRGLGAALELAAGPAEDHRFSAEAAREFGFDLGARADREFLAELLRLRGLDASLAETSCCPL